MTVDELGRYFERVAGEPLPADASVETADDWAFDSIAEPPASVAEAIRGYLATAEVLGRRTGELHVALADSADPAFAPEPLTKEDVKAIVESMRKRGGEHLNLLEAVLPRLDEHVQDEARQVLRQRNALLQQFDELRDVSAAATRIRCHGDYHLGQVLVSEGDVVILDFEGEPARRPEERRVKCSPVRDVAGMLRSFSYAALTAVGAATQTRPDDARRLAPWADFWERWISAAFLRAVLDRDTRCVVSTRAARFDVLLRAYVLDKALYELAYELNNRPSWVHIPLAGVRQTRPRLHA